MHQLTMICVQYKNVNMKKFAQFSVHTSCYLTRILTRFSFS